jgi:hypothetical protein
VFRDEGFIVIVHFLEIEFGTIMLKLLDRALKLKLFLLGMFVPVSALPNPENFDFLKFQLLSLEVFIWRKFTKFSLEALKLFLDESIPVLKLLNPENLEYE